MSAPVTAVPGGAPVPAPVAPASAERKAQVEALVDGILKRMDYPARLELKDMADGGIGVAVHFGAEALPGISPGKRTWLLDCLQFIVNKATNRPTVERRWVSLGANGFSEPRTQKPERDPAPVKAPPPPLKTAAPPPPVGAGRSAAAKPVGAPSTDGARDGGRGAPRGPRRGNDAEERGLDVTEDPALSKLFASLAERSAKTGRPYAVLSLSADDRARALKAAGGVKGVSVRVDGEGYFRRVVYTPDKVTPMPSKKQVMPDYDDEEE